jgi:nitroimidazol reductase NimA-like FMN-containing flavoprotein (pyridoxamine 5'-phosphate oxidase superfamily)
VTIEDWQTFLTERPIAVLATVGPDGYAHAVAVEIVVRDGSAYVWCESYSVKARNAEREGKATLSAYKSNAGVMVRGTVRSIRTGDAAYEEITTAFTEKYPKWDHDMNDLVLEIKPARVTTWG